MVCLEVALSAVTRNRPDLRNAQWTPEELERLEYSWLPGNQP